MPADPCPCRPVPLHPVEDPVEDRSLESDKEGRKPLPTCYFFSALGGNRTPNLLIRSQMLYPLSYERWVLLL